MTKREQMILRRMNSSANSFERARSYADGPAAVNPGATVLAAAAGNPGFAAQFDINFLLRYFTVVTATGVATVQTPAQIIATQASLATRLAFFLYGNSDFAGGFAKMKQALPLSGGWIYGIPIIFGKQPLVFGADNIQADATITAQCNVGDLIIPAYFVSGANTLLALMIVRCNQVGYGTLLDSLNSDMFVMNMIRYIMSDTSATGLAQYNNNIGIYKQSLFGKFDQDFISPTSFKMPEQMQDGIVDIPLEKGIDKQVILGSYQNYNVTDVQWSLFVSYVEKRTF